MGSSKTTSPFFNCPAFLIRNPYSYCFRMNVPRDLQDALKRKELRYSLQTGHLGEAKYQARRIAGFVQWLFRDLREGKAKGRTIAGDIQQMIDAQFRKTSEQQPSIPPAPPQAKPIRKPDSSEKLFRIIELYIEEQERGGNWSPKSRTEFGACLTLLSRIIHECRHNSGETSVQTMCYVDFPSQLRPTVCYQPQIASSPERRSVLELCWCGL